MRLTVNGSERQLDPAPFATLLEVLRDELELTGTKLGCDRGECGACTVLLEGSDGPEPIYACLTLALGCDGRRISTVEGLAPSPGALHPLQAAFVEYDAAQCGYCTPGQLMAAAALLAREPHPSDAEITRAMSGTLCRCGTYPNIRRAIRAVAGDGA